MNKFFVYLKLYVAKKIRLILHVDNLSLELNKLKVLIEKRLYKRTYDSVDILNVMSEMGLKRGSVIIIHSSMKSFYNYRGTAEELILAIINYIGPEGTLCMPSYPYDKDNQDKIFNVKTDASAAGYMSEIFRTKFNSCRSLNKLHSVCAIGKYAKEIVSDHHLSKICFDEYSPYFKLYKLNAITFNFGMPKWFLGTIEHVPESILAHEISFFTKKFSQPKTFKYLDFNDNIYFHTMYSSKSIYIRNHNSDFAPNYFIKSKFSRRYMSNLFISAYDSQYLVERLIELAKQGITIYSYPNFYDKS